MAQTKKEIQALLEQAGSHPRHRFGQNFMIDQNLVRLIAAAGEIGPGDTVVEVGPGTGTLTDELLASPAARVIAVEIDRDLATMQRQRLAGETRFTLIEGDALAGKHALNPDLLAAVGLNTKDEGGRMKDENVDGHSSAFSSFILPPSSFPFVKLIANLPYNIASPLVIELLIAGVEMLVFTVQKEVADRLQAGTADEAYGPLTVMAQWLSEVEVMRNLPPSAFWPAPKIASSLVRMRRRDRLGSDARAASAFVHAVFAFRRKTMRRAMIEAGFDPAIAERAGVSLEDRPERVSPEQWLAMFRLVGVADKLA